jgi:hypothetical protein
MFWNSPVIKSPEEMTLIDVTKCDKIEGSE